MTPRFRVRLSAGIIFLTGFACALRWAPLPELFTQPYSTILLDRHGQLLGAVIAPDGQWRFPMGDSIPQQFQECLIQFEDRNFRDHWGVHVPSMVRAVLQNIRNRRVVSGGSTLSMQVARMGRGRRTRSIWHKLDELVLAIRLEMRYEKDAIMAMYCAHAPFGGNVVGLEAAAWRYFGRPASGLSWAECATLAVLPNAPSVIYPGKAQTALRAKRNRLLARLLEAGMLDPTEHALALSEPLPDRPRSLPRLAPHLLHTLMAQGQRGVIIRSTLDADLQAMAANALEHHAPVLQANEVHNAAAIVLDTRTGEVLAYVGNLHSSTAQQQGDVDIVQAPRSTGSLLKPFLFAAQLDQGELLPGMLVADIPTRFDQFTPRNTDRTYTGAVRADVALARSLNIPAVRALHQYGVERTLRLLRSMGIEHLDRSASHYGLSLIIGGGESTLAEITGAYASLGRILLQQGQRPSGPAIHPPRFLVEDTVALSNASSPISPAAVHLTLEAMRQVKRPGTEHGWTYFHGSEPIAWKTGTSYGHRDGWAVGLTASHCVGVWTGNATGEGRPGLTGTLAAAPILFELFGLLPQGPGLDPPHDELHEVHVCARSGFRAGPYCGVAEVIKAPEAGARAPVCPFHKLIQLDATGRYRTHGTEARPTPWFVLSPAMERYVLLADPTYKPLPPWHDATAEDDLPVMELIYPMPRSRINLPVELDGSRSRMVMEVAHRDPNAIIHWHLDGSYLGATQRDHRFACGPAPGTHSLTLTDAGGHVLQGQFQIAGDP